MQHQKHWQEQRKNAAINIGGLFLNKIRLCGVGMMFFEKIFCFRIC
jgi:hypothetical protein